MTLQKSGCIMAYMAKATIIGKSKLPAGFNEKEIKAFLTAAGIPEQAFIKKFKPLRTMDDIAEAVYSDTGRFGRAFRKAALASGEAMQRDILSRN